ncbi:MAG: hypothetical protein PHR36_02495 [Patescibacteria group bacterium]|nr:hypothetical protein [Patescibacteria group bacterium]
MKKIRVLLIVSHKDDFLLRGLVTHSARIRAIDIIDISAAINSGEAVLTEICRDSERFFRMADIVIYIADPAGFVAFAGTAMEFRKPFVASTNSYKITDKGTILIVSETIPCVLVRPGSSPEEYAKKLAEATISVLGENPGLYALEDDK